MSQACAQRCNIMRLLDKRFAGIAKGVGTQKILGRIHTGQIQIKESFIPQSFSVMEDQPMEMLIGLGTGSISALHKVPEIDYILEKVCQNKDKMS